MPYTEPTTLELLAVRLSLSLEEARQLRRILAAEAYFNFDAERGELAQALFNRLTDEVIRHNRAQAEVEALFGTADEIDEG